MRTYFKYGMLAFVALITLSVVMCGGATAPIDAKGRPPTDTPAPTDTPPSTPTNIPPGTYYVDCSASTNGDGSQSSPWNNLDTVNAATFAPGSSILFKRGTTCNGQLYPKGSGTDGNPIVLDTYGTGAQPIIAGGGVSDAVYLHNQEYWELRNLEVTNTGASAGNRRGVHIDLEDFGAGHYYRLVNLTVHDVNGDDTKDLEGSSGIHFTVHGGAVQTKFEDVVMDGNTVYTVDRSGINMSSAWWCRPEAGCSSGQDWYPWGPFSIRNNLVYDVGGDGIVNQYATGSLVEYNVVHDCNVRSTQWNVGIWGWNADDVTYQYNEAYLCRRTQDGQGFDIDYAQKNTTHQYEYSHDNEGGFMLICGNVSNGNLNGIVRYCISQDDEERIFQLSGPSVVNALIYNNTIYVPSGNSATVILESNWDGYPTSAYFYNNIFYHLGSGDYDLSTSNIHFDYNVFYGNHPSGEPDDPHKITADPLLVNPGSGGTGIGSVGGYKLQAGSPALAVGKVIADNGGKDYWGNAIPQNCPPDIGAHQYSDVGADDCTPVPTPTPDNSAMHVEDIYTTDANGTPQDTFNKKDKVYWRVQILTGGGSPVEGADVTCAVRKPDGQVWVTPMSTTGADGWALFNQSTTPAHPAGTYTINVTNVVKSGVPYNSMDNVKDSHQFYLQ